MIIPYFYSAQIRKYLFAFADVFNGLQIAKYNSDGSVSGYQTVPIIFPNQDKYFTYYNQKINGSNKSTNPDVKIEVGKTLPSFSIKDLSFNLDSQRTRNKYDLICEAQKYSYIPTPYQIKMNLKLNFEKLDECFQIIEQILPLFNSVMAINVNPIDSEFANNLSIPIFLESTSNLFPSDLPEEQERIHQYTLSMRMDIWLFGKINNQEELETEINFGRGV